MFFCIMIEPQFGSTLKIIYEIKIIVSIYQKSQFDKPAN